MEVDSARGAARAAVLHSRTARCTRLPPDCTPRPARDDEGAALTNTWREGRNKGSQVCCEFGEAERFSEEVVRTVQMIPIAARGSVLGTDEQDRGTHSLLAEGGTDLQTVHTGEAVIENHDVVMVASSSCPEAVFSGVGDGDGVSGSAQPTGVDGSQPQIVLDDQHTHLTMIIVVRVRAV